jgi:alkylresorcinol/alkylpyrone synthase
MAQARADSTEDRRRSLSAALSAAPWVGQVAVTLADHAYDQAALVEHLKRRWSAHPKHVAMLERLHASVQVDHRCLALPLEEYEKLTDFGAANDVFIRAGTELAARVVKTAIGSAGLAIDEIDAIFFTTVTGVAVPTIDARLINTLPFRTDVRRTPMFGLGCVGGAAGLARTSDYLRGHPDHTALFLSVELCSLTLQDDLSVANLVATGLFGDGAAAVVLSGSERATSIRGLPRARVVATRSTFFRNTERVMGWDVGGTGFKVVLSAGVPDVVRTHLPAAVDGFLRDHGLTRNDIRHWVCHPGGPKVITAIEESLALPPNALAITRESLASVGNLSSASVLDVLGKTQWKARSGDLGLLMAMGPGFCAELVLLSW